MQELESEFERLKKNVEECLKKYEIDVMKAVDALTLLQDDGEDHQMIFLDWNVSTLQEAADHSQLFETMNLHWNYLDPSLLDHLVRELNLDEVKDQVDAYKSDLRQFRRKTALSVFCGAQPGRRVRCSPTFRETVAQFKWPRSRPVMLEDVEQFREESAHQYSLHQCALMVQREFHGSSLY